MTIKEIFFITTIGALQIILELIPLSSSSHIMLIRNLLKKFEIGAPTSFPFSDFEYFLHGETILIIFIFFRARFLLLLSSLLPFQIQIQKRSQEKKIRCYAFKLFFLVCASTAATLVPYFLIKKFLTPLSYYLLLQCFGIVITALLLYLSSYDYKGNYSMTFRFLILGIVQGCAAFPGISRLGATYAVGKILGLRSDQALYYSFLIHLPLCLGGFILGLYKLLHLHFFSTMNSLFIIITLLAASILSYGALYMTSVLAQKNKLYWISIYLIIPFTASLFLYWTVK